MTDELPRRIVSASKMRVHRDGTIEHDAWPDGPPPLTRNAAVHALERTYEQGWLAGVTDAMRELERLGCFTTAQARRHVERIRARIAEDTP